MDKRSGVPRVREVVWLASLCVVGGACAGSDERADLVGGGAAEAIGVSPELEIDPPDLGPAAGQQPGAGLIRAGDHYLAVWLDNRTSFDQKPAAQRYEVMGARIDQAGAVLDPAGFPIATDPVAGGSLDVSCNPDGLCLLVSAGPAQDPQTRVVGVRVLGNQVLDTTSTALGAPGSRQGTVAWDGTAFRVLWTTMSGDAFMRLVDEDGAFGAAVPVAVPELESLNAIPDLACGGPRCLLTYRKSNGIDFDVMGRMLDTDGSVSDEFPISAGPISHIPTQAVWDGARYWIVVEAAVTNPIPIRVIRIEADGTILEPEGVQVGTMPSVASIGMALAGTHLLVSWQVSSGGGGVAELRSARVTLDADVLDPGGVPFFVTSPPGRFQGLTGLECHTMSCLLLVWEHNDADGWIRGFGVEGATVVDPDGFIVTTSPPGQVDAAVAFGSGRHLAVWQDSRLSDRDPRTFTLRGTLFSPAMDEFVPFEIDPVRPFLGFPPQKDPTAAASASSYLVAWTEALPPRKPNVYGEVLGPGGQPIRSSFAIQDTSNLEDHPSAASSGDSFLVAWERLDAGGLRAIRASRFDASGVPLPPERFLVTNSGYLPAAGFDGVNYLVVWQRPKSPTDSRRDVVAARVSQGGAVLDPTPIVIADTTAIDHSHSVGCGGGLCLVVWHTAPSQLRALRLAPEGTVLDPGGFLLATAGGVPATSVVFDGAGFVVGWQTKTGDMHGAVVSPDGVVTEPPFVIANAATALQHPVVASDGAGHRFVLYDRFDPSPAYNVRRVRARVLEAEAGP
jgi:hypothetical protein